MDNISKLKRLKESCIKAEKLNKQLIEEANQLSKELNSNPIETRDQAFAFIEWLKENHYA